MTKAPYRYEGFATGQLVEVKATGQRYRVAYPGPRAIPGRVYVEAKLGTVAGVHYGVTEVEAVEEVTWSSAEAGETIGRAK